MKAKKIVKSRKKVLVKLASKPRKSKLPPVKILKKSVKKRMWVREVIMANRRKPDSIRSLKKLRESVLDFLHERKDRIVIVECRDQYVIVAKRIKLVTVDIINSNVFQPVEQTKELEKIVLAVIALQHDLSRLPKRMSNLLCRQLVEVGAPVLVIRNEMDIREKLGE